MGDTAAGLSANAAGNVTGQCAQITPHTIAAMNSIAAADAIQCSIFTATCPNLKQESPVGNAPGSLFVGGHNAPERLHEQTAHLVDLSGDVGPRFSHLI